MDSSMKQLRVRFSGVGKGDQGGSQNISIPPQQSVSFRRGQMSDGGEYDAAFAATVAAAAYAIAAREEERLASQRKPFPVEETSAAPPPVKSPIKKDESMKKPTGGSKISRWFSGKDPTEDDDGPGANISVRRPLAPAQRKPEGTTSDQKVLQKPTDATPTFSNKSPDRKGSKKYEQEQASQKAQPTVRPATSYSAKGNGAGTARIAASGEAGTRADEWEKAKLAKIKEEYDKMMETIAEWENEKKVKARRQKDQKEIDLDRKRAKALKEYNDEIARINKIVGGARSMAEERKRKDENKIKEKATKIRSTGKLPRSCACF